MISKALLRLPVLLSVYGTRRAEKPCKLGGRGKRRTIILSLSVSAALRPFRRSLQSVIEVSEGVVPLDLEARALLEGAILPRC